MAEKLEGGVFASIEQCMCCGDRHRQIELYAPPVPPHVSVFDGFSRDNTWYLCPSFIYAVPYALGPRPRRLSKGETREA